MMGGGVRSCAHFGIRLRHPVVQTNLKDKTPFIAARHIVYYYGD